MMLNRNIWFVIFIVFIFSFKINAQSRWTYGFGVGLNFSNLEIEKKTNVNFDTPYQGTIGFGIKSRLKYKLISRFKGVLEPGISFFKNKDEGDLSIQTYFFDLPLLLEFKLRERILISTGIYFQYLFRLNEVKGDNSFDNTFFANNRHFYNPNIGITFIFNDQFELKLEGVRPSNDLFNRVLTDSNGTIIDSSKTYNHFFQLIVFYHLSKKIPTNNSYQ